jgi:hypothetical protein
MIPIIPSNHLKKVSSALRKSMWHLGKSTRISLKAPPRNPGSPFKGIRGKQGEAKFGCFLQKKLGSTLKEIYF